MFDHGTVLLVGGGKEGQRFLIKDPALLTNHSINKRLVDK